MADAVQQILERLIPTLEELQAKGVFTAPEIKSIVSRRREHEYAIHRRTPEEADFVRAIEYELNLEALRRRRKAQLGLLKPSPSDHAGVRRIHFIFERAARKFRRDPRWWIQWVDFSMRTNAARAVDRIVGRALMLHPRSEELWLLAAEWQFDRLAHFATARSLMTRGVRVNRDSRRLWLAFFRMECVYALRMRGRRLLLGLDTAAVAPLLQAGAMDGVSAAPQEPQQQVGQSSSSSGAGGAGAGEEEEDDYVPNLGAEKSAEAPNDAAAAAVGDASILSQLSALPGGGGGAAAAVGPSGGDSAQSTFLAGSVAQLIFDQAVSLLPADVAFRLEFLRVVDSFVDEISVAAAAGAASSDGGAAAPRKKGSGGGPGTAPPAFPGLRDHILTSIATAFPSDARMWRELAARPIRLLAAEMEAVAAPVHKGAGGAASGSGAAAAAGLVDAGGGAEAQPLASAGAANGTGGAPAAGAEAGSAALLPPDDLFVIDTRGTGAEGTTALDALGSGEAEDGVEADLEAGGSSIPPRSSSASAGHGGSSSGGGRLTVLGWARSVSCGALDARVAGAVVREADEGAAAEGGYPTPLLLPRLSGPLWELAPEHASAAAAAVSAAAVHSALARQPKRKRGESSDGPAASPPPPAESSPALPVRLHAAFCSELKASASHLQPLYASAARATDAVLDVVRASLEGENGACGVVVVAACESLSALLTASRRLPMCGSEGQRVAAILSLAATLGERAIAAAAPAGSAPASSSSSSSGGAADAPLLQRRLAWVCVASVQALMRLGRIGEALALADAAAQGLLQAGAASIPQLFSMELRRVLALAAPLTSPEAVAAACGAGLAAVASSRAPDSAAPPLLEAWTPEGFLAWADPSSQRTCIPALLPPAAQSQYADQLLAAMPHASPALWRKRFTAEARSGGGGAPARVLALLQRALRSGPPPAAAAALRSFFLGALYEVPVADGKATPARQQAVLSMVRAAAPVSVVLQAVGLELGAVVAGAGAPPSVSPEAQQQFVRALFECATPLHGASSSELWVRFLRFERAASGAVGAAGARVDRGSVVYSRALLALAPGPRAEFVEAAARGSGQQ